MNVLVTNDDGVHAPGLAALATALRSIAEVWVVAPEREQSAQSHAFTLHKPLRVTEISPQVLSVSGTPADCAYAAINGLIPRPDLVLSGINRGANLGTDVHYSGTVAAAREAVLQGIPAIAVSLYLRDGQPEPQFERAAGVVLEVVDRLSKSPLPPGHFLNINVPNTPSLQGVRAAPLGRSRYDAAVEERRDPRGRRYVWIGGSPLNLDPDEHTDVAWARRGYTTLTPLAIDPTAYEQLEVLDGWF